MIDRMEASSTGMMGKLAGSDDDKLFIFLPPPAEAVE
jgi:hypothetical protein